jgi:hypothetical protein
MATDLFNLLADRPWLEEVGYHSDCQASGDGRPDHGQASCCDPRCDAPDHHDITEGRDRASGGVLVAAQQTLTVGDIRFAHQLRMGGVRYRRRVFDIPRQRKRAAVTDPASGS